MAAIPAMRATMTSGARLLLGGTFAYAAVSKLFDPQSFVTDIGHYRLLPYPVAVGLGLYLPWLEIVCAFGVILRWREQAALGLTLGLCAVFSVALASAWVRGIDISCGCFGVGTSTTVPFALTRAIVLGLIAHHLLRQSTRKELASTQTGQPAKLT